MDSMAVFSRNHVLASQRSGCGCLIRMGTMPAYVRTTPSGVLLLLSNVIVAPAEHAAITVIRPGRQAIR